MYTFLRFLDDTMEEVRDNQLIGSIVNIINWIVTAIIIILSAAMVGLVAWRGWQMARADGEEQRAKAKKNLVNTLIGFGITLSATIIVRVLMNFVPQWLNSNAPVAYILHINSFLSVLFIK